MTECVFGVTETESSESKGSDPETTAIDRSACLERSVGPNEAGSFCHRDRSGEMFNFKIPGA